MFDYRTVPLTSTSSAVDWDIDLESTDTDVERIALHFSATPTTAEDITISLEPTSGGTFVIRSLGNNGVDYSFEDIRGIDLQTINVSYANSDGVTVTGFCTIKRGDE